MFRAKRDYVPGSLSTTADERWHYIAEASLVYHTPIGPVSLALTKYDLRNWKNMYLTFNFGYAIFAPKEPSIDGRGGAAPAGEAPARDFRLSGPVPHHFFCYRNNRFLKYFHKFAPE